MRTRIALVAVVLAAAGCGTSVSHRPRDYQLVGTALPVEVSVDTGKPVSGTVSWRVFPETRYTTQGLELRADQLWTFLPTETVPPDSTVEYYIDVQRDGELFALGSPSRPFATDILDYDAFALAQISVATYAGFAGQDVRIVLNTAGQAVGQPTVEFIVPGLPGSSVAPMDPDGRGNYAATISGYAVAPGTWSYAVEMPMGDTVYRIPDAGWHSFVVKAPPAPQPAHRDHDIQVGDITIDGVLGGVVGPGSLSETGD